MDFFYCYDINLRNYLITKKSIRYICYGLHPTTMNPFWQFLQTPELQQGISEYKKLIQKVV